MSGAPRHAPASPQAPTGAELAAIAAKHGLGGAPIRPMAATGVVNRIYALGDRVVLRVANGAHPDAVCDALTESVAAPAARAAGVPTPRLLALDDTRDIVDTLYTLYERAPGEDLATRRDTGPAIPDATWEDLGRRLAALHRDVTDVPDPHGRLDAQPRWDGAGQGGGEPAGALLPVGVLPDRDAALLAALHAHLEPVVRASGAHRRFLHGDLSPGNVMSRDDRVAAFIDWGDAGWGDPAQEFSNVPLRTADRVLAGYRTVRPLDGDATAEARILWSHLGRLTWWVWREHDPARLADLLGFLRTDLGRAWLDRSGVAPVTPA